MRQILLCLATAFSLEAATNRCNVTLVWEPSPSTNVVGYNVYWGNASRSYSQMVNVGNKLTVTLTNMLPGSNYFFAATAYEEIGLESDYSEEAAWTAPVKPQAPRGVALVSMALLESSDATNWVEIIKTPMVYVGTTNGARWYRGLVSITNN